MHVIQRCFERSAKSYYLMLNDFLSNIDIYNYAQCRIFIINLTFYVFRSIQKSPGISKDTYKNFRTLCKRLLTESIHNSNIAETIYVLHLYRPLSWLLEWHFYRVHCLFKYEKAIKYIYNTIKSHTKTTSVS
jgi:hypothetical protein